MNRLNEHIVPPTTSPTNIICGKCACNPSASSVQEVQSNYVELLIVHLLSILISHIHSTLAHNSAPIINPHLHSTLANSSASTAPSAPSTTTSSVLSSNSNTSAPSSSNSTSSANSSASTASSSITISRNTAWSSQHQKDLLWSIIQPYVDAGTNLPKLAIIADKLKKIRECFHKSKYKNLR